MTPQKISAIKFFVYYKNKFIYSYTDKEFSEKDVIRFMIGSI